MRVLLLSMPDSFEHTPALTMRMPNGALASLAGNVGSAIIEVAIADLILVQDRVVPTVERLMREHDPDVVGLSVMTFQRRTALRLIATAPRDQAGVTIVAGGYDPSLAPEAYEGAATRRRLHRPRRRRADVPRAAARAGARRTTSPAFPGLSFGAGLARRLSCTTRRARSAGSTTEHRAAEPRRAGAERLHLHGPADRHRRDLARLHLRLQLLLDHRDARPQLPHLRLHARARRHRRRPRAAARGRIFIVDDNITLNVARFEALCHAIVDAGLNDIHYIVQAMTSSIANHGETLAPLMRQAGFRYVFLGIENVLDEDLAFLRASAKNAQREGGRRTGNATLARHRARCTRTASRVVGGIIVGNPDDTRDVDRDQPRVRAALRGLAVHPASDAVSGHADDRGLPRAAT